MPASSSRFAHASAKERARTEWRTPMAGAGMTATLTLGAVGFLFIGVTYFNRMLLVREERAMHMVRPVAVGELPEPAPEPEPPPIPQPWEERTEIERVRAQLDAGWLPEIEATPPEPPPLIPLEGRSFIAPAQP